MSNTLAVAVASRPALDRLITSSRRRGCGCETVRTSPASEAAAKPSTSGSRSVRNGVAIEASHLTLVSGDLRGAADAIRLARRTLRYCIDVLTQISAVTTALESLAYRILDDHVNHCVSDALASGDADDAAAKSKELLDAVHRFTRTR